MLKNNQKIDNLIVTVYNKFINSIGNSSLEKMTN